VITAELNEPRVLVPTAVLREAERWAIQAMPYELGGILVGWWEGKETTVVSKFLVVPDSTAGYRHYNRQHAPAQKILDDYLCSGKDERLGYVGEWHSHPLPQPPSPMDHHSLTSIVRRSRHCTALVVLSVADNDEVIPHALVGQPQRWGRIGISSARI